MVERGFAQIFGELGVEAGCRRRPTSIPQCAFPLLRCPKSREEGAPFSPAGQWGDTTESRGVLRFGLTEDSFIPSPRGEVKGGERDLEAGKPSPQTPLLFLPPSPLWGRRGVRGANPPPHVILQCDRQRQNPLIGTGGYPKRSCFQRGSHHRADLTTAHRGCGADRSGTALPGAGW